MEVNEYFVKTYNGLETPKACFELIVSSLIHRVAYDTWYMTSVDTRAGIMMYSALMTCR